MSSFLGQNLPCVMGVLNVTPDSFSDGGAWVDPELAVRHALKMEQEGAALVDVGGESTRPGAAAVSVSEELDRVIPVIQALQDVLSVPISIDSKKPEVMSEAVKAGARMINDVNALNAPGALEVAVDANIPVCLMHMKGSPENMQENPQYADVTAEVKQFFAQRVENCLRAGIRKENIVLDPGFGFGKTVTHNFQLMRDLNKLVDEGFPLLVGVSRKSMIGAILDVPAAERVNGGAVLAALAIDRGASIVRTHDVKVTVEAIKMTQAVRMCGFQESTAE